MKSICMFCGKSHKKKPKMCQAKGDILRAYLNNGVELWQFLAGMRQGLIDLDGEAYRLMQNRKSKKAK